MHALSALEADRLISSRGLLSGDQGYSGQRAIDGGSPAANQRGHRSAFGAPRYGKKLPTPIMTLLLGTPAIGLGMVGSVMGVWDAGFLCSTPFTVPFLRSLCG